MRINLTDNNINRPSESTFRRDEISVLFPIAGRTISELCKENENILIFPYSVDDSTDDICDYHILNIENTDNPDHVRLCTGNILGFLGIGNVKIKIKSRFDEGRDDYFLHYMLQRIMSFNLFDLNHNNEQDDVFDFIMFMFPYFLKDAIRQGIYREYKRENHDDSRIRGVIDVNRFINHDIPFRGNVSCSIRNYCNDNDMTELIRHTIEYMKTRKYGKSILNIDTETANNVRNIISMTPGYDKDERKSIIQKNLRPKVHPYYTKYKPLQALCIQILRMEEIKYGDDDNEVCGILFDGAWLWEEYVNTIISHKGFIHAENKNNKNGIYLFEDTDNDGKIHWSGIRFPDFYRNDFVLDAKYKRMGSYDKVSKADRNDIHQVITYMTRLNVSRGGFIAPLETPQEKVPTSCLKDSMLSLSIYGIEISKCATSYADFKNKMSVMEDKFVKSLNI